jgi:DNA-binding response OmpR family regulator
VIPLSPTEFSLLEVLMRNEGRVVSQSHILDHVWGYDSWPESNLIPVYVTYLRRKFKAFQVPVQIIAIRGVGYILGD